MNMKQIRALRDFGDMNYAYGLHCGRWENEDFMDSSAEEYLDTMIVFAEEYEIEYDKDLSHYIQDEEYEAECYTMDNMGYEIQMLLTKKLLDIINGIDGDSDD